MKRRLARANFREYIPFFGQSRKVNILFPTDDLFFLSVLTGFLALVVGLSHQKFIPASFDELFAHDAYVIRGWPAT